VKRLAWCALLALGCGGAPERVSLNEPTQVPTRKQYGQFLKRWTRHSHVINDFDDALDVNATLRSPEFRSAYASKYIVDYKIVPENRDRVRGEIMSEGADTYEFHVETQTHDYDINDLTSAKTVWRITLINDQGHELPPREVLPDKAKREVDVEFYPYATIFSRAWRLRFPRATADGTPLVGSETKTLTLRFAGPVGVVDLVWPLQPPQP
jgi:hypothetical protein